MSDIAVTSCIESCVFDSTENSLDKRIFLKQNTHVYINMVNVLAYALAMLQSLCHIGITYFASWDGQ